MEISQEVKDMWGMTDESTDETGEGRQLGDMVGDNLDGDNEGLDTSDGADDDTESDTDKPEPQIPEQRAAHAEARRQGKGDLHADIERAIEAARQETEAKVRAEFDAKQNGEKLNYELELAGLSQETLNTLVQGALANDPRLKQFELDRQNKAREDGERRIASEIKEISAAFGKTYETLEQMSSEPDFAPFWETALKFGAAGVDKPVLAAYKYHHTDDLLRASAMKTARADELKRVSKQGKEPVGRTATKAQNKYDGAALAEAAAFVGKDAKETEALLDLWKGS
ncbi:hypothetical protein FACS1894202_00850 [Clostridia bacterium]|nr:hypothetical protein FACS1894202_00850 [Clostridia bacterium]